MKNKNSKKIIKKLSIFSTILFGCLSLILFKYQVQADPNTGCGSLRSNELVTNTTTASDTCVEVNFTSGNLSFAHLPSNLNFPSKFSSNGEQDVFSSDNPNTPALDAAVTYANTIAIMDRRYNGGFSLDLSIDENLNGGTLSNGSDTIPVRNIYVNTTPPDLSIIPFSASIINGIWYINNFKGPSDIAPLYHSNATDLNLTSSYQTSFDDNHDNNPDTITLMSTSTSHNGIFATGINFYVKIPASQPSGTYDIRLVLTLQTR